MNNIKMIFLKQTCLLVLLGGLWLAGCTRAEENANEMDNNVAVHQETPRAAVARIQPLAGSAVRGTVTFAEVGDYVQVSGTVSGLARGKHGFHVHTGTSCEDYGGHFAPEGAAHGAPDATERHVGDLGNLVAGDDSTAHYDRIDQLLALTGSRSIVGHALIVHQGEDDYLSQPSGNSGTVIGCGIIQESSE